MNDNYVPQWPAAELDTLINLFRQGLTFESISEKIPGRSKSACIGMARRIGLSRPKPEREVRQNKPAFWTDERNALLRKLWAEGVKNEDIAARLGKSRASIKKRAERLGLPSRGRAPGPSALSDADFQEVLRLYRSGMGPSDIARRFKVTAATVIGRLHRAGVVNRRGPSVAKLPRPATQNPNGVTASKAVSEARRAFFEVEGQKHVTASHEPANDHAIPLIGRPFGTCAFPVGTPDRPANQLCCGQPKSGSTSMPYCERHAAKAGTGRIISERDMLRFMRRAA